MRRADMKFAVIALLASLPLCAQAETVHSAAVQRIGANMAFSSIDDAQTFNQSFGMHNDMVAAGAPTARADNDPGMIFDGEEATTLPVIESTPLVVPDDPSIKPTPAAAALAPNNSTQAASPGPAHNEHGDRPPELPQPSVHDVRQELWAEWADKFQLLQDENTALREKLRMVQGDGLQDIRVDSVAQIEQQALKSRIADLEKEVEQLRAKKTAAGGASSGAALPGSGPMNLGGPAPLARTHSD